MLHEVVKCTLQTISLPASCLRNYDFHYLSGYMLGCSWASSATCDSLFTPNVLAELRGTVDGVVEKLEVHCSVAWWSFHMIGNTLVIKLTEEVPPPVPAGPKFIVWATHWLLLHKLQQCSSDCLIGSLVHDKIWSRWTELVKTSAEAHECTWAEPYHCKSVCPKFLNPNMPIIN